MRPHPVLKLLTITLCLCYDPRSGQAQQTTLPGSAAVDINGVRHQADEHSSRPPIWDADLTKRVPPDYSYDARKAHLEGTGLFRLELDVQTGRVSKVSILRSTGVTVLDNSALWALRRWRMKPGRWREMDVPIAFSMSPPALVSPSVRSASASNPKITYAATASVLAMFRKIYTPAYPYEARRAHMEGRGVFRMYIDENGVVTRIGLMKSTGYKLLDMNASFGLMHWKARPGHRREVDMPVTFIAPAA